MRTTVLLLILVCFPCTTACAKRDEEALAASSALRRSARPAPSAAEHDPRVDSMRAVLSISLDEAAADPDAEPLDPTGEPNFAVPTPESPQGAAAALQRMLELRAALIDRSLPRVYAHLDGLPPAERQERADALMTRLAGIDDLDSTDLSDPPSDAEEHARLTRILREEGGR